MVAARLGSISRIPIEREPGEEAARVRLGSYEFKKRASRASICVIPTILRPSRRVRGAAHGTRTLKECLSELCKGLAIPDGEPVGADERPSAGDVNPTLFDQNVDDNPQGISHERNYATGHIDFAKHCCPDRRHWR